MAEKQAFDVSVMIESFKKANEVQEILKEGKITLTSSERNDVAITFFNQSMKHISESRKSKQSQGGYY